jgi:hypothetical protein
MTSSAISNQVCPVIQSSSSSSSSSISSSSSDDLPDLFTRVNRTATEVLKENREADTDLATTGLSTLCLEKEKKIHKAHSCHPITPEILLDEEISFLTRFYQGKISPSKQSALLQFAQPGTVLLRDSSEKNVLVLVIKGMTSLRFGYYGGYYYPFEGQTCLPDEEWAHIRGECFEDVLACFIHINKLSFYLSSSTPMELPSWISPKSKYTMKPTGLIALLEREKKQSAEGVMPFMGSTPLKIPEDQSFSENEPPFFHNFYHGDLSFYFARKVLKDSGKTGIVLFREGFFKNVLVMTARLNKNQYANTYFGPHNGGFYVLEVRDQALYPVSGMRGSSITHIVALFLKAEGDIYKEGLISLIQHSVPDNLK